MDGGGEPENPGGGLPSGSSSWDVLLSTKVEDFGFSVRARNIFARANIRYLGDLIAWDAEAFLSLPACGKTTLDEVHRKLRARGLDLGMNAAGWEAPAQASLPLPEPKTSKSLSDYDEAARTVFLLRTNELAFSNRTMNVVIRRGVEFIGELVQENEAQLKGMKSCGRKSVDEIRGKLAEFGLRLGMQIADWDRAAARALRKKQDREEGSALSSLRVTLVNVPEVNCLEKELEGAARSVAKGRDADVIIKVSGWSGNGKRTLESVGQEYGLTRERIRQIAARVERKLRRNRYRMPWLTKAIMLVRSRCPATPREIATALRTEKVSVGDFDPTGLETACDVFGKNFNLSIAHIGRTHIYESSDGAENVSSFFRACRRATSNGGCVNFEAVCDELKVPKDERENFRHIADADGLCEWLDEERRWLFTPGLSRNRLANLISKVLSVCPTPHLSELRRAVGKSRRIAAVPPLSVLARFVERYGLATISGDKAIAKQDFRNAIEPRSAEETMVSVMRANGPALAWDRFQELCVGAGMNPVTFGIYLSVSPVIARLARGVYSLVGADVPPGVVEDIGLEIAAARKSVEWGWTARGMLWCALHLTGTGIASGAVTVPSFVRNTAVGEWSPRLGGQELDGTIKCGNGFLWGLRRPLSNAGAEPGDICILEFDVARRTVDLTLGGEDLIDLWERGDNELPISEPQDVEEPV